MRPLAKCRFAPEASTRPGGIALLLLRLWLGLTMLLNHGLAKLINFSDVSSEFLDLFGVGSKTSLALALFAEVVASALLTVGLLTRFAAFTLCNTMLVAFVIAYELRLSGERSGALAFSYLAEYFALLFAGPGRYSANGFLFSKPTKPV